MIMISQTSSKDPKQTASKEKNTVKSSIMFFQPAKWENRKKGVLRENSPPELLIHIPAS
jgi:hypothetical protein